VKFDDTVGEVSGTWVTGRVPSAEPGLVVYMLVESVEQTLDKIREAGGEVVTPLTPQGEGEAFATFRDSAGNVLGIGQQP
jgi:predicted enzyme related to lactoylglutathione lyase